MTDDDKRQQKAMLLLEHQEAEDHLANLEEKAKRISSSLYHVQKWIERITDHTYSFAVSQVDYAITGSGKQESMQNPQYREAMNFDAILKLAQEIKDARAKVDDLKKRKDGLGLK